MSNECSVRAGAGAGCPGWWAVAVGGSGRENWGVLLLAFRAGQWRMCLCRGKRSGAEDSCSSSLSQAGLQASRCCSGRESLPSTPRACLQALFTGLSIGHTLVGEGHEANCAPCGQSLDILWQVD